MEHPPGWPFDDGDCILCSLQADATPRSTRMRMHVRVWLGDAHQLAHGLTCIVLHTRWSPIQDQLLRLMQAGLHECSLCERQSDAHRPVLAVNELS